MIFVIEPIPLLLPSLNISFCPSFTWCGLYLNRILTFPLSPADMNSWSRGSSIVVSAMVSMCVTLSYPAFIVVGCTRIATSASNSLTALGLYSGWASIMPLSISCGDAPAIDIPTMWPGSAHPIW